VRAGVTHDGPAGCDVPSRGWVVRETSSYPRCFIYLDPETGPAPTKQKSTDQTIPPPALPGRLSPMPAQPLGLRHCQAAVHDSGTSSMSGGYSGSPDWPAESNRSQAACANLHRVLPQDGVRPSAHVQTASEREPPRLKSCRRSLGRAALGIAAQRARLADRDGASSRAVRGHGPYAIVFGSSRCRSTSSSPPQSALAAHARARLTGSRGGGAGATLRAAARTRARGSSPRVGRPPGSRT